MNLNKKIALLAGWIIPAGLVFLGWAKPGPALAPAPAAANFPAQTQTGAISISGAFALYPLTVKWADEFKKAHPGVRIDISAGGAGKGITDVLSNVTDIGLVSRDLTPEEIKKGAFALAVTKDAVVPTISASNPFLKELQARGIKKEALNRIFITGEIRSWGQLGLKTN